MIHVADLNPALRRDKRKELCYTIPMLKEPLIKTNPYLQNPAKRLEMFCMTVYSSTGIEGVITDMAELRRNAQTPKKSTSPDGSLESPQ